MQDNVTQADREAAATAYCKQRGAIEAEHSQILSGLRDDHVLVGLFARHRLASTAQPEVKALVEALEIAEPYVETMHSLVLQGRDRGVVKTVWNALVKIRAALAAYHEAQP